MFEVRSLSHIKVWLRLLIYKGLLLLYEATVKRPHLEFT